jgi:hypothetical protein
LDVGYETPLPPLWVDVSRSPSVTVRPGSDVHLMA